MDESISTLHIYGPAAYHDAVWIVGTTDALQRLRDALTAALATESVSRPTFFTNDGEGFHVNIVLESEAGMDEYCVPYTADYARPIEDRFSARWPKKSP